MKQYLVILGLALILTGIYSSCKTDSLEALREDEVVALNKYVKDNNLTDAKDESGIYFKLKEQSDDTTLIRKGFKVMLEYNITLLNGTVVFTTNDGLGHNYEAFAFYVDVNDVKLNEQEEQKIAGLHRGLKKMHVGERAFMVIPSELAFKAIQTSVEVRSKIITIPRFSTLLATVYAKSAKSPAQLDAEQ